MGLFSFLSGSKKAVDTMSTVAEGAVAGLDKLFFTKEEKHDAMIATGQLIMKRVELAVSESSIRSITRRVIAIMFCSAFLLLLLMSAFVYPWFVGWSKRLFECSMVLKNPIIAIIIFYFGSYGVGYLLDKKK